jgi:NNP family nitrate/nitrite transporter-like MFS transporter
MSDKWGARKVMYWVLGSSVFISFMLILPRMEIYTPGKGIMADQAGTITAVSEAEIIVDDKRYPLIVKPTEFGEKEDNILIFPTKDVWQERVVEVGEQVRKKEIIAKGLTRIFFQANVWIFAVLVILLGSVWGIGKAAVYKYIPDNYPDEVGVVGGMVGVLGGLGGFFLPNYLWISVGRNRHMDQLLDVYTCPVGGLLDLDAYGYPKKNAKGTT